MIRLGEPFDVIKVVRVRETKIVKHIGPKTPHALIKGCFYREVTFDDGEKQRYNANQFFDTL